MLNETIRLLECHEHTNFSTICTDATNLQIPEKSLDFVCTFNAIHHFDPIIFLEEASKTLKDEGYVFVYTRLKSQNARNIREPLDSYGSSHPIDFYNRLCFSQRLLPSLVDLILKPDEPTPSLHLHYRDFITTTS
jgi:SAM-dependent methyltransferase